MTLDTGPTYTKDEASMSRDQERSMVDPAFRRQIEGYSLTTAEILYHMPDHPGLLQSFVWQHYDVAPEFPRLVRFLDFWVENIESTLSTVRVAHWPLVAPVAFRLVDKQFRLH